MNVSVFDYTFILVLKVGVVNPLNIESIEFPDPHDALIAENWAKSSKSGIHLDKRSIQSMFLILPCFYY